VEALRRATPEPWWWRYDLNDEPTDRAEAGAIAKMTDTDGSGSSADAREAERERLALWLGQMVSELAGQRGDELAELRAQAVALAQRFRDAGEDQIARKLLLVTRLRASAGRRQEWLPVDYAILATAVFLLMWREHISVRAACRRLADRSIDRSWFLVFDCVVAARHRPTEHALYEQFRIWLRTHKSSISELKDLAKANGGVLPDAGLPPHLLQALSDAHAWFTWVNERVPSIEGPNSRKFRERQARQGQQHRPRTACPRE
jgi:hypothetical protein